MPKQAKDFVFSGKETFDIAGGAKPSVEKVATDVKAPIQESVVLNIDEDDVILSKNGRRILGDENGFKLESTGFFLSDLFAGANKWMTLHSTLPPSDKAEFFHLFAVLINSGVPMIKSLKSLIQQVKKESHIYYVIKDILSRVEAGGSLSEALSYHPEEFDEMEIGMIESGEASGHLNQTLHNLAEDLSRRIEIKHKIKSAMIYPVVIICLLVAVLIGMMVFIIPKLKDLFTGVGKELPLITRIVVGISDSLVDNWVVYVVGLLGFILFIMMGKKTYVGRFAWDKMKLSLPAFGKLFKKTYLARFARALASLLGSGVPIIRSLEITSSAIGNEVYKRRIYLSSEDMKQGIPLAENLSDTNLFPPMIVNMIEIGEKTAQLDEILVKVAYYYEEEVSTSVEGLAKILEPLVLIVIGVSVGAIMAAVMLPIMNLTDMAGAM